MTCPDLSPKAASARAGAGLFDQSLTEGRIQSWDFLPFKDASRQSKRNSMDLDGLEVLARYPCVRPRPAAHEAE